MSASVLDISRNKGLFFIDEYVIDDNGSPVELSLATPEQLTRGLQECVRKASQLKNAIIQLPPIEIRLTDQIKINRNISIRGYGTGITRVTADKNPFSHSLFEFHGDNPISFSNAIQDQVISKFSNEFTLNKNWNQGEHEDIYPQVGDIVVIQKPANAQNSVLRKRGEFFQIQNLIEDPERGTHVRIAGTFHDNYYPSEEDVKFFIFKNPIKFIPILKWLFIK